MNIVAGAFALVAILTQAPQAQSPRSIPIRMLAPAVARTTEPIGFVRGLRELVGGRLLVNDGRGRRLMIFDPGLATFTLLADSSGQSGNKYPRSPVDALYPYLGDSTLFVDWDSRAFVVVDPSGRIVRAMAHPRTGDLFNMNQGSTGTSGIDAEGRFIYPGRGRVPSRTATESGIGGSIPTSTRDTAVILRADFEVRTVDTIAQITIPRISNSVITTDAKGKRSATLRINPVPGAPDDWAVLSGGSLAIIRAQDYHIDWIYADGTHATTPKMPFDWRRLTDDDKRAKIDSVRLIIDSLAASGIPYGIIIAGRPDGLPPDTIAPRIDFAALEEMSDYVPPIRSRSAKPDRDGNLWILPTTSLQAKGGLLYDVVNKCGELFERVQLPAGRDIAGFGSKDVIYLQWQDGTGGYCLERTKVLRQ